MKGAQEEHCSIDSYQATMSDGYGSLTLHIIPPTGISVWRKKKITNQDTTGLFAVSLSRKKIGLPCKYHKEIFFF